MSRKPLFIANWKMNLPKEGLGQYFNQLFVQARSKMMDVETVIAPPYPYLTMLRNMNINEPVTFAAQNTHEQASGAYTGEVSASMLKETGADYVLIGHSERRQFFHETDTVVNSKIKMALSNGLMPVVCLGEQLEARAAGRARTVVQEQLQSAFFGIMPTELVIAYEPVWAIGTGKTATPEQAQEMHAFLRGLLSQLHSVQWAQSIRILYGGSVKPDNAADLMRQTDIDGALVGGASLQAADFAAIIKSVPEAGS